jgi:hypothetical protein
MRCANWLVCSLSMIAVGAMAEEPASSIGDFGGQYVVTDIVGYADVSGGEPVARKLLGQTLVISPDAIDFDGEHCIPNTGFRVKRVVTEPLLKEYYGVPRVDVGLPVKTTVLDSDNCVAVFRMDKYRVVLGSDGVVVRAIRDSGHSEQAAKTPAQK